MKSDKNTELLRKLHHLSEVHPVMGSPLGPDEEANAVPFDFAKHDKYAEIKHAREGAKILGLESPFFRSATSVNGTKVQINGKWVDNFASYDYLGLNSSPHVRKAAAAAAETWGVSSTASRLVGGERALHNELDDALASFLGAEAALTFVSGHATNVAILRTLVGPGDLVLVDTLAHNSIFEGIRASGAAHRTFPHNDWEWVNQFLRDERESFNNVLVAIEGLYSMDGDTPDLARFVEVKFRHNAWLLLDEAHSLGVVGATGRGVAEAHGIDRACIDVTMGTLSKTFASCGGVVAGSNELIDLLRYMAPSFIYSVGLSLPNTAAALAAVETLVREPERVAKLAEVSKHFKDQVAAHGLDFGLSEGLAVAPIIVGDSLKATRLSNCLLESGFNVLPIISPAVPDRSARLRFFLNKDHEKAKMNEVVEAVVSLM